MLHEMFFTFSPVRLNFPYATTTNVVGIKIYSGMKENSRRSRSIDVLSSIRPETPSRNKSAREENGEEEEIRQALITRLRI